MNKPPKFGGDLLQEAQQAIGYRFRDETLLKTALTHKSVANAYGGEDNERLEFLGDAVLELVVSQLIYLEQPHADEGDLTALRQQYVSKPALFALCEREGFMRFLQCGGRENVGKKTVESLPEAILGAIYLDGGLEAARAFVSRFVIPAGVVNYKSLLQEFVQGVEKRPPDYEVTGKDGDFYCTVRALGREASGRGATKKAAEFAAAEKLYRTVKE